MDDLHCDCQNDKEYTETPSTIYFTSGVSCWVVDDLHCDCQNDKEYTLTPSTTYFTLGVSFWVLADLLFPGAANGSPPPLCVSRSLCQPPSCFPRSWPSPSPSPPPPPPVGPALTSHTTQSAHSWDAVRTQFTHTHTQSVHTFRVRSADTIRTKLSVMSIAHCCELDVCVMLVACVYMLLSVR